MKIIFKVMFWLVILIWPLGTAAAKNVALIVGNANYQHVLPLDNPLHDADLAARTLEALGFDTRTVLDAEAKSLRNALREFQTTSAGADIAAIFYAGHGVQANNINYLLAVDTGAETRSAFEDSAIRMEEFLAAYAGDAKVKLLIVDACRDNPFAKTRSLEKIFDPGAKGLSRVNHQLADLLVIYSAQPNHKALDGDGRNSPFMEAFSSVLTASEEVRLTEALIDITNFVRSKTADKQLPYSEGTLSVHVALTREKPLDTTPRQQGDGCPVDGETVLLQEGAESYLEFAEGPQSLIISDGTRPMLHLCPSGGSLLVDGNFDERYTGADLRNADNGGSGYYFMTGDGRDAHLWFYADPDPSAPAQIGVYIDGQEITWITTSWVF